MLFKPKDAMCAFVKITDDVIIFGHITVTGFLFSSIYFFWIIF